MTGKMAALPVANIPAMRKFEARKARDSCRARTLKARTTAEARLPTRPSHQKGLVQAGPGRSGRTILDSIKTTRSRGTTAQNQTPQNQKEGEIVTGKRRRHQAREDRDQCSAETEEPYLMPCP